MERLGTLRCGLNGETFAALVAAAFDDPSAIGGRHPFQKTMCPLAPSIAGLISNRHCPSRPSPEFPSGIFPDVPHACQSPTGADRPKMAATQ